MIIPAKCPCVDKSFALYLDTQVGTAAKKCSLPSAAGQKIIADLNKCRPGPSDPHKCDI